MLHRLPPLKRRRKNANLSTAFMARRLKLSIRQYEAWEKANRLPQWCLNELEFFFPGIAEDQLDWVEELIADPNRPLWT